MVILELNIRNLLATSNLGTLIYYTACVAPFQVIFIEYILFTLTIYLLIYFLYSSEVVYNNTDFPNDSK